MIAKLAPAGIIAMLFGVAAGAVVAPEALAGMYGISTDEPGAPAAYVRGLGIRDAALGAIALAFALRGERAALRTTLGFSTIVAIGDFTLVSLSGTGERRTSLTLHAAGIVALLLATVALRER